MFLLVMILGTAAGVLLYVVEAGRQHKELIVLVHGLGAMASATWQDVIPVLAERYHVLAFDLPGFGRSSKTNRLYSPDNYTRLIDFLVTRSGHQKFMLVGYSLGGNITLRYATLFPEKVKRLLLIDAAGVLHRFTYTSFVTHFGIRLLPQFYPQQESDLKSVTSVLFGQLAAQYGFMEMGEQMLLNDPEMRSTILGGDAATIATYAMLMTDYSGQLRRMNVPTLLIWGQQDQVTPLRIGKVLATNLPEAGLVVFEDTGHSPVSEKPDRFRMWLQRFADSTDAAFRQLLADTRYRIDAGKNSSEQIVHCKNEQNLVYTGDYKFMIIENCRNIQIDSARIKSLTIKHSQVILNNCIIHSEGKAILAQESEVEINGCKITGSPAIEFENTGLDIAGSQLMSATGAALRNLSQKSAGNIFQNDTIMFSVTSLLSRYKNMQLHGPVTVQPNAVW